jgi:pimeloyl-ACP methyl ester carboxylesterase
VTAGGALRTLLAMLLTVVLGAAVACSADKPESYDYFRVTVDGQQTLGISAKNALVRAVVVFFHDAGTNEFAMAATQNRRDFTGKLVNAGFAVVSSYASGDAWGNAASQRNYVYVGGIAAGHYGTENIFFLADGMGAVAAANLLATGPSARVRGFAAINPILDLSDVAARYKSAVASAYPDGPTTAPNPMAMPVEDFAGKKMRFYLSPADSIVPADANARAFEARFASVADISIVECAGPHGDASCFQGDDIVKWFSQLEKRS